MLRQRRWLLFPLVALSLMVVVTSLRWVGASRSIYRRNLVERTPLGAVPSPKAGQRVLVFAPHEDDETLGCGGYIQKAVKVGSDIHVVLMTNGEFPEIDVILFERTLRPTPDKFIKLGYLRQQETLKALKFLGVPSEHVTFLGYPNQYLDQMWLPEHWLPRDPVRSVRTHATRSPYRNSMNPYAVYCGQSVLDDVRSMLLRYKPDVVITLHPNDIHVDHWPTYAFVRFALEELEASGRTFARNCRVYSYLIHRDDWPAPKGYHPKRILYPPADLVEIGQTDWMDLPLTFAQTVRKHEATRLYRTQLGSADPLLLAFARKNELYGVFPVEIWRISANAPLSPVVVDPPADLIGAVENPHADIEIVSLGRRGNHLICSIATRGKAVRNTIYHMSLRCGGGSPSERTIVHYQWGGGKPSGFLLRGNRLIAIEPGDLETRLSGNTAVISVPWPFPGGGRTFYMLHTWTARGLRPLDKTAVATFRVSNVSQP